MNLLRNIVKDWINLQEKVEWPCSHGRMDYCNPIWRTIGSWAPRLRDSPLYFTIATLGTSYAGSRKKLFLGCVISHWEEPRKRLSAGLCVLRFQFNWQNSAMHLWLQIIKKSRERKYLCQSATKSAALWFIALQFLRFRVRSSLCNETCRLLHLSRFR